ncbi:MAG: class I SAM-dependent methyltransferase [Lachnospiraceae bacterium]|nr:class I SAM-dependent methyltransferase [Lachnospiraceae bacterium]
MGELKYIPFEEELENIKSRVTDYWTERADSFFLQRQHELNSVKADRWLGEINAQLAKKSMEAKSLRILDIGCGSGFFEVLLGREGHEVTGIDLTEEMIVNSKKLIEQNGPYAKPVNAIQMDAEKLSFADESFDVVISRNLTWTLPHPIESYAEWNRVLKKGGMLLNFDAEYAKGAHNLYTDDNIAHKDISDKLKDECHAIYHMLTISNLDRPEWDGQILLQSGFSTVDIDINFCERIFAERDEFYIPDRMFMITAVK